MLNNEEMPFEGNGKPYGKIAERIKEAMRLRGLRQIDLAERSGISKGSISQYISGKFDPKQVNLYQMAKVLRVRPDWLMGLDVPMEEAPVIEVVPMRDSLRIPVLGKVAAGEPIYADQNIEGELMVDPSLSCGSPLFALKVKGDSMSPQILDKDIIIVREQCEVEDGDIVVATVNGGEGCVKRLRKYAHAISLVSVNPAYEPMYFGEDDVENLPVRIMGKVLEIRRHI